MLFSVLSLEFHPIIVVVVVELSILPLKSLLSFVV
jgi:hypothetical protein